MPWILVFQCFSTVTHETERKEDISIIKAFFPNAKNNQKIIKKEKDEHGVYTFFPSITTSYELKNKYNTGDENMGIPKKYLIKTINLGLVDNPSRMLAEKYIELNGKLEFSRLCRKLILIFLNLFRDQLDRYGEVDSIARKWKEALVNLS